MPSSHTSQLGIILGKTGNDNRHTELVVFSSYSPQLGIILGKKGGNDIR